MDVRLSRASIIGGGDPHSWNALDSYVHVHETHLEHHPFVDPARTNTIVFELSEDGVTTYVRMDGTVFCLRNVIVNVTKTFETRSSNSRLYVRGTIYRYVAWVQGGNLVLKYHNLHDNSDEYHHRAYDPQTGVETLHEVLERRQFPVFSEVLDEAEYLTSNL